MVPFECSVPVRFSDLDAAGVVNNAIYATLLEEARVRFLDARLDGFDLEATPFYVTAQAIDYRQPIRALDPVDVTVTVPDVGETSFTLAYDIHAGSDLAAEAETVQVAVDPETWDPRPVPEDWREQLA